MYLSKLKYENRHSTNISDVSHLLDNIITLLWGNKNFCDRIKYLWKYPFRENRLSFHASYEIVISYQCPTWHLKWTCAFPKKKNRRVLENDISFQYPTSVVITKIQEWLKYYILEFLIRFMGMPKVSECIFLEKAALHLFCAYLVCR